jgi:CRP/FNR family transcriptional regulator, cyclic AMP receptor protein
MLIIQRNDFLKLMEQNPTIATGVLSEMSRRIRMADERIGNLILLDVYGRVARFLLDLARREGKKFDDGVLIEKRPTQQDIASMIGASRETVSRVLSELNRRGLISISGKSVMIFGPDEMFDDEMELLFPGEKVDV